VPDQLYLRAAVGTVDAQGLSVGGGTADVIDLTATLNLASPTFAYPGSLTAPDTYFAGYFGTYAVGAGSQISFAVTSNHSSLSYLYLTPTSVQISTVPEPSTYAVLLGSGVLGLAVLRRRRIVRG
jgi:hypothetical protein